MWVSNKKNLDDIYLEEEIYWKQRSKKQMVGKGDLNTSLFHRTATVKKQKILILSLDIEGQHRQSLPQIQKHIMQFYQDLFGVSGIKGAYLDQNFWDPNNILSEAIQQELEKPVTNIEIYEAIFQSDPNGFGFLLYQHFWGIAKDDIFSCDT